MLSYNYKDIGDIQIDTNTGRLLFSMMGILSGDDFVKNGIYESRKKAINSLVNTANYIWSHYITTEVINPDSPSYIILERMILIITSEECQNGLYGGHMNVDEILINVVQLIKNEQRELSINLLIQ